MRNSWESFAHARSVRAPHGAQDVSPDLLVALEHYRLAERSAACGHVDPLRTCLAYAQTSLVYDEQSRIISVDAACYEGTPREQRVNIFGPAYRPNATLWLHQTLADIMVSAAISLYQTQGWITVVFDGLRTVDGAFNLYQLARDEDLDAGLLALPGKSAHNKGLAVDSMMFDAQGREIEMGGHFDHPDMRSNARHYTGPLISTAACEHRRIREAAFLRAAFTQGLLIAPLRNEFWDDRLPEDRADLWRVLDSAARVMNLPFQYEPAYEDWTYAEFLTQWQHFFAGHETRLEAMLGRCLPPESEQPSFYHGNFHPIYDSALHAAGKHLTDTIR